MDIISSLTRHIDFQDRRTLHIAVTAPIVGYFALRALGTLLARRPSGEGRILLSPRRTLASSSKKDLDELPYPPDALPGERDVGSPYGSIRVYEWGPEGGRKVLLVHGMYHISHYSSTESR